MMEYYKPVILIGLLGQDRLLLKRFHQVAWGIEEESCLYEKYSMENRQDIQYSIVEATVVLTAQDGKLYVNDLNKNNCLLTVTGNCECDYRTLGKNAARYLKKMRLCL